MTMMYTDDAGEDHVVSDAEYFQCDVCGRKDYAQKNPMGATCDMTQPGGRRCPGFLRKKSDRSAVSHQVKAQDAADKRDRARMDLGSLIECLSSGENREDDVPEGAHPVTLSVSVTLAAQWVESLEYARKLL